MFNIYKNPNGIFNTYDINGHVMIIIIIIIIIRIIIIIMNFYSPVSNTRCHSIGHKIIKIRVYSPGRWERA